MRHSLERTVGLWFLPVAAISIGLGVVTFRGVSVSALRENRVGHTHEVLRKVERIFSMLEDAESGAGGLVITSDPRQLDSDSRALPLIEREFGRLEAATVDTPGRQARLGELEEAMIGLLQTMGENLGLEAPEDRRPTSRAYAGPTPGLRVLIVDDDHTNRRIPEEILWNRGARPSTAIDVPAALEAFRDASNTDRRLGVAELDGMVPGMVGFGLVDHIRDGPGLDSPLMIMLTSNGELGESERARSPGIAAYTRPGRPDSRSYARP